MLEITDDLLMNRGSHREVYLHPENEMLVVKVPLERQPTCPANIREFKGYRDIVGKHGRLDCISRCHGFVGTNRGEGLVGDCIRDDDGTISSTIWELVVYRQTCDVPAILEDIRHFCGFLIANDIRLFDLNLKNIAMRREKTGRYQPTAIDLKSRFDNSHWMPFSSRIKYFSRKRMERRSRQLLDRIVYFREHRHEFLGG